MDAGGEPRSERGRQQPRACAAPFAGNDLLRRGRAARPAPRTPRARQRVQRRPLRQRASSASRSHPGGPSARTLTGMVRVARPRRGVAMRAQRREV